MNPVNKNLHFGCGSVYFDGWNNVDLDSPLADLNLDLTQTLPFADASVSYMFSEHFIEHVTRKQAVDFLVECRRILRPSGTIRVSTPNLRFLIAAYLALEVREWLYLSDKVTTLRSDENVKIMLQSLKSLLQYEFDMLFCASGRVIESGARQAVKAKVAFWEEQQEKINQLHNEGLGEDEILKRLYGRESALYELTDGDFGKINLIRSFNQG